MNRMPVRTRILKLSAGYLALFLILFVVASDFVESYGYYILGEFLTVLSLPVLALWAGKILEEYGRHNLGTFVSVFVSIMVLFIFLGYLVSSVLSVSGVGNPFVAFAFLSVFGLGVSSVALMVKRMGDGTRFVMWLKRIFPVPFLLGFALLILASPGYGALSLVFLAPVATISAFSAAPYLYYSSDAARKRVGGFLYYSYGRWLFISLVLGIAGAALLVNKPPGYGVLVGIAFLAGITVLVVYLVYKAMLLGSDRIEKIREKVYSAHEYKLYLYQSESEDFMNCAREFIRDGRPERLILVLGVMLASLGMGYRDAEVTLYALLKYRENELYSWNVLNIREMTVKLMQRRTEILNGILLEAEKWAKKA